VRRTAHASPRRQILTFVEGRQTEERYIVDWHRRYRGRVIVIVDRFRGVPLSLVKRAMQAKVAETRNERGGRGRAPDEIWCVFDVDDHPNLPQAIDLARRHGIHLAISNPCLELWFVLHFEDQAAWIARGDVQRRSQELLNCGKVLTDGALAFLYQNYAAAAGRAELLEQAHLRGASAQWENPSSGVRKLVASIIGA